jgi:hypothetical protein
MQDLRNLLRIGFGLALSRPSGVSFDGYGLVTTD